MNCSDPTASRTRRHRDQIYFIESIDESVEARLERARLFSLAPNRDVFRLVETYIRRENPYAQSYRMLKEVLANVQESAVNDVILAINPVQWGQSARRTVPLEHRYYGDRCQIAATSSVAAVFVGEVPPVSYDVLSDAARVQQRTVPSPVRTGQDLLQLAIGRSALLYVTAHTRRTSVGWICESPTGRWLLFQEAILHVLHDGSAR